MNDVIKLLPDSVANQIAAGEVIQRPASVIKELVENSVDAGATSIEIIIKDAGRTLIQVVDNGRGMTDTDARMAFERHATSKITTADDLLTLHTMGFRGEALASIAAVAQIDLRTMTHDGTVGTRLQISGTRVDSQEPCACAPGTNMMVKNLFYTVPARRKFLKKDTVEFANIVREFERLALVNPTIDFTLIHNDNIFHQLRRASMKQRICDLFGKNLDKQLIPVTTDTSIVRIDGFIGLPANARKRNQLQYLLINGRNMRHPLFHKAILECYDELLPHDQQPNYFVSFSVDPETIDVNIHPTKNEIKFENEFGIRQILMAAVKESLGKFSAMPGIEFDVEDAPEIPAFNPDSTAAHGLDLDTSYNPFAPVSDATAGDCRIPHVEAGPSTGRGGGFIEVTPGRRSGSGTQSRFAGQDWGKLYEEFTRKRDTVNAAPLPDTPPEVITESKIEEPTLGLEIEPSSNSAISAVQVLDRYIATPCKSGLMLIDQNRAHIRILYDRYVEQLKRNTVATQTLIFPEMLTLSPSLSSLLESMTEDVAKLGFNISPLGDHTWSICGVPAVIENANPGDMLQRMLEETEALGDSTSLGETVVALPALALAKAVAVKNGTRLKLEEIERLLSDLFSLPTPNYTPDGRTVIVMLCRDDIVVKFNREK